MKKIKIGLSIIVLSFSILVQSIYGDDTRTSSLTSLDIMSNYVWRGQKLSNSWVVQPSVAINYGVFGTSIWANYDSDSKIDEGNGHGEFTETDITLSYTRSIDKWTFATGYIYYALNNANDTQEVYLSISYDMLLKPTLTIYYDFDEGNGAFITASIGHTVGVLKDINLNFGVLASYNINSKVMGLNKDGEDFSNFYNAEASTSLNIPVWKAITITPKLAYSIPLSSDAKEAIKSISDDGDRYILYGGISLSLSF